MHRESLNIITITSHSSIADDDLIDPKDFPDALQTAQAEIARLRLRVQELSWDEPFGMLTRNAFLQHCRSLASGVYQLIFVDLDDIGQLNSRIGYDAVDRRIRDLFTACQQKHLVARWYSGDEIVILLSPGELPQHCLVELRHAAKGVGLSFVSSCGVWDAARQPVETVMQALAAQATSMKSIN